MLKNRIKELRIKANLSQAKLGSLLNLTQQAIAKWEKGVSEPDSENINELAKIFNVDVNYLLGNTDNPKPLDAQKEAIPSFGSEEWLRQGLVARGHSNLTDEQLSFLLSNLDGIATEFDKKINQDRKK